MHEGKVPYRIPYVLIYLVLILIENPEGGGGFRNSDQNLLRAFHENRAPTTQTKAIEKGILGTAAVGIRECAP